MKSALLAMSLLLVCFLTACVEVRDKNAEPNVQQSPPAGLDPEQYSEPDPGIAAPTAVLSIEVNPLPEPHRYQAQAKNTNGFNAYRKISPGEPADGSGSPIVALNADQLGFIDTQLTGGRYVYQLGSITAAGFRSLQSKVVVIPNDLVIDPAFKILESTEKIEFLNYGRIFISNRAVLNTQGRSLIIRAAALISENGVIQTFPAGQTANLGQPGRSGGKILIQVQKISGRLLVNLRGENGAKGVDGTAILRVANAASINKVFSSSKSRESVCENGGYEPAERGQRGNPGADGTRGGTSGSLEIVAVDATELNLDYRLEPGAGGAAGFGGAGQRGGAKARDCSNNEVGESGADGDWGPNGHPGIDGRAETVCVLIKGEAPNCRQ